EVIILGSVMFVTLEKLKFLKSSTVRSVDNRVAVARTRVSMNAIMMLKNKEDRLLQKQQEIAREVLNFYKGLLGSQAYILPSLDATIMRQGITLIEDRRRGRVWKCDNGEVKKTPYNRNALTHITPSRSRNTPLRPRR
ncbi:hypothetical protein HAX54_042863, partial [Datura stramonium]|nr:hypothetical protein [Datura stramonium]